MNSEKQNESKQDELQQNQIIQINTGNMDDMYKARNDSKISYKWYIDFDNTENNAEDIATDIHNNYNTIISDRKMLLEQTSKLISSDYLIKIVSMFELINYQPQLNEMVNTVNDAIDITIKNLKKYQGTVGGFLIEDDEWIKLSANNNTRFKLKPNQVAIYNTIDYNHSDDSETKRFLSNIIKLTKRHITDKNIVMEYNIYEDESYQINWIFIVCQCKNNE
jgi:hypothetical protein